MDKATITKTVEEVTTPEKGEKFNSYSKMPTDRKEQLEYLIWISHRKGERANWDKYLDEYLTEFPPKK